MEQIEFIANQKWIPGFLVMVCQQGICRFVCISVFVGVAESNKNEKTARLVLLRSVLGAFFVKMPLFLGLRRMPEIYSHFCFLVRICWLYFIKM